MKGPDTEELSLDDCELIDTEYLYELEPADVNNSSR